MANPTNLAAERLERLRVYLDQDPTNVVLLAEISDLHLQAGDWQSASERLEAWLAVEPRHPLVRYRLAIAEEGLGLVSSARARLEGLVEEGHRHPSILEALARHWGRQAEWGRIRELIQDADLDKCSSEEFDRLMLFRTRAAHHEGDAPGAVAAAEHWIAKRAESAPLAAFGALSSSLIDCERLYDVALLLERLGDKRVRQNAELLSASGFVALSSGNAQAATSLFGQAEALQPNQGRALLGRGLAAASLGDVEAAISDLMAATRVQPRHLGTWHALAWLQVIQGSLADGEATFRTALELDDNFGESHGGLALIAALRGQREAAQALLRVASRLDARSMNAWVATVVLERGAESLSADVVGVALERLATQRVGTAGFANQVALQLLRRQITAS